MPTWLPGAGFVQRDTSAAAGTATCTTQVAVVVMVVMLAFNALGAARNPSHARKGMALNGLVERVNMGAEYMQSKVVGHRDVQIW